MGGIAGGIRKEEKSCDEIYRPGVQGYDLRMIASRACSTAPSFRLPLVKSRVNEKHVNPCLLFHSHLKNGPLRPYRTPSLRSLQHISVARQTVAFSLRRSLLIRPTPRHDSTCIDPF